jgi:amidohydrolase
MSVLSHIKKRSNELKRDIIAIRQHIHAHPELSMAEFETTKFICGQLDNFQVSYTTNMLKTGAVALIKGKNPNKKTVALRADIDALPIQEQSRKAYCSQNNGVMHACGHDVHTASLLGAAKIINELKDNFEGTVKLIFQPSEEKLPGGALLMIKNGVLKNPAPKSIIAQHVYNPLEVGQVGFHSGEYMASCDEIYMTVKGKGGHAAMPNDVNNPLIIASKILIALQEYANQNKDNSIPMILSFGKIIGNGATNVVPDEVYIEGTFRTMNEKFRKEAHNMINRIAKQQTKECGGKINLIIEKGYPVLYNNPELTSFAKTAAEEFLGKKNVITLDKRMTSEDFAYYSHRIPACFYRLGTGNKSKGITSSVHTSTFDIDENALVTGMGLMAWMAIRQLTHQ